VLPTSSLARLVAWQQVAVTAAACWSALVALIPLACLVIPVHQTRSQPAESVLLVPPVRYERPEPVAPVAVPVLQPVAASVPVEEPAPIPAAPAQVAAAQPADPVPVAAAAPEKCVACEPGGPGAPAHATYGTAIKFNGNPLQAADEAAKEKRLLFVLHISGNFEDDRFT
jgi:hypothetical protein